MVSGVSGASEEATQPALGPPADDPTALASEREALQHEEQRQIDLATPAARAAREVSQDAFEDQSRDDALATLRSSFQAFATRPFWPKPELGPGETIQRYVDDNEAVVDRAEGRDLLLASTAPLRADGDSDHAAPVNTTLVGSGDDIAPVNAPVDVEISHDPDEGARLGDAGIGVAVPHSNSGSNAAVTEDKAFYANVGEGRDTDLIIGTVPEGLEVAFQLRSAASPEDPTLALDLPEGAELHAAPESGLSGGSATGAWVSRDGETIARILPPIAEDADHSPVPAWYEARGSELAVRVDHRGRDVHYPILVDPLIEDYSGTPDPANSEFRNENNTSPSKWLWGQSGSAGPPRTADWGPFNGSQGGTAPTTGSGLKIRMDAGGYYPAGSWAHWMWVAPPNSRIVRTDFLHVAHDLNSSLVELGITNGWVWQGDPSAPLGPEMPAVISGEQTDTWRRVCTDPDTRCGTGGATDGNAAIFRFKSTGGGNPRANSNYTAMGETTLWIGDNHPPTIAQADVTGQHPSGWVDQGSDALRATARDPGLGLKSMTFGRPSLSGQAPAVTTLTCPAGQRSPCFSSYAFPSATATYGYAYSDLPQGDNTLSLTARDIIGNAGSYSWHVKRDSTPPETLTATGLAVNQTIAGDASVSVHAADGSTGSPSAERSGVKSIDVQVLKASSRAVEISDPDPTPQSCASSCAKDRTWTVHGGNLPSAQHILLITATDQLGHKATKEIAFTVSHPPVNTSAPAISGTSRDDQVLTGTDGTWSGPQPWTLSYQWQRCDVNGQNCVDLDEEIERKITLRSEDVGFTLRLRVKASEGSASATAVSAASQVVAANPPSLEDAPTLDGSAMPGEVMSVRSGVWNGSDPFTYTYRWYRCDATQSSTLGCLPIAGATGVDYTVQQQDAAFALRATVTASNVLGPAMAGVAWSDASTPIGTEVADPDDAGAPPSASSTVDQIADAQRFRDDFGLTTDPARIQALDARSDLEPSRDQYGVSLDRDEQRHVELRQAISARLDDIAIYGASFPGTYAGYYVDQHHGGLVYVGFTSDAASRLAELKQSFAYPEHLRTFTPARNLASLKSTQQQVEDDADSGVLAANGVVWTDDEIDVETNRVLVGSEPASTDSGVQGAATMSPDNVLTRMYGGGVAATPPDPAVPTASRTSYHKKAKAGLKIYERPYSPDSDCTLGFIGTSLNWKSLQRERAFLTAGHCSKSSTYYPDCPACPSGSGSEPSIRNVEEWRQGEHNLGYTTDSTINTSIRGPREVSGGGKDKSDAVTISLARGEPEPLLYWNNLHTAKVTKVMRDEDGDEDALVCVSRGETVAGSPCGHVLTTTRTVAGGLRRGIYRAKIREARVVDVNCNGGDSGSPVVETNDDGNYMHMRAIGMVSARTRRNGYCIYTSIINIQQQAAFQVELG